MMIRTGDRHVDSSNAFELFQLHQSLAFGYVAWSYIGGLADSRLRDGLWLHDPLDAAISTRTREVAS